MNTNLSPILDFNNETNKGMLFDVRDGQSYQVVKIGNQIWLAENFRYLPSIEKGDLYETSYVYKNDNSYLNLHYGRLYDWDTANSIAPEGWKLPSNEDFIELIDFIRKDNNLNDEDEVGSYLKSVNGWDPWAGIKPNNDKYGFNAKPAGCLNNYGKFDNSGNFNNAGSSAYFWSAAENNSGYANNWLLFYDIGDFNSNGSYDGKYSRLSVRLIKVM